MQEYFAALGFLVLLSNHPEGAADHLFPGTVSERAGVTRDAYLLRQGLPIQPSTEALVRGFCLENAEGKCVPAVIEPEARDEDGKVRWLRVEVPLSLPAWRSVELALRRHAKPAPVPPIRKEPLNGGWRFTTSRYSLERTCKPA